METEPIRKKLGTLLIERRIEQGLSRAEVARQARIAENSLARYEKAGEEKGQFPPPTNLARLCMVLRLDIEQALLACLDDEDYWHLRAFTMVGNTPRHPDAIWMERQYVQALRDCNVMRSALELFLPLINPDNTGLNGEMRWLLERVKEVVGRHEDFEARMLQMGFYWFDVSRDVPLPNQMSKEENTNWVYELERRGTLDDLDNNQKITNALCREISWNAVIDRLVRRITDEDLEKVINRLNEKRHARTELHKISKKTSQRETTNADQSGTNKA